MQYPCPLCRRSQQILINRKNKPYLRCDSCGVLMFINKPAGIGLLEGFNKPAQPSQIVKTVKTAGDALFN